MLASLRARLAGLLAKTDTELSDWDVAVRDYRAYSDNVRRVAKAVVSVRSSFASLSTDVASLVAATREAFGAPAGTDELTLLLGALAEASAALAAVTPLLNAALQAGLEAPLTEMLRAHDEINDRLLQRTRVQREYEAAVRDLGKLQRKATTRAAAANRKEKAAAARAAAAATAGAPSPRRVGASGAGGGVTGWLSSLTSTLRMGLAVPQAGGGGAGEIGSPSSGPAPGSPASTAATPTGAAPPPFALSPGRKAGSDVQARVIARVSTSQALLEAVTEALNKDMACVVSQERRAVVGVNVAAAVAWTLQHAVAAASEQFRPIAALVQEEGAGEAPSVAAPGSDGDEGVERLRLPSASTDAASHGDAAAAGSVADGGAGGSGAGAGAGGGSGQSAFDASEAVDELESAVEVLRAAGSSSAPDPLVLLRQVVQPQPELLAAASVADEDGASAGVPDRRSGRFAPVTPGSAPLRWYDEGAALRAMHMREEKQRRLLSPAVLDASLALRLTRCVPAFAHQSALRSFLTRAVPGDAAGGMLGATPGTLAAELSGGSMPLVAITPPAAGAPAGGDAASISDDDDDVDSDAGVRNGAGGSAELAVASAVAVLSTPAWVAQLAAFLAPRDVGRMAGVCKAWRTMAATSTPVWAAALAGAFPTPPAPAGGGDRLLSTEQHALAAFRERAAVRARLWEHLLGLDAAGSPPRWALAGGGTAGAPIRPVRPLTHHEIDALLKIAEAESVAGAKLDAAAAADGDMAYLSPDEAAGLGPTGAGAGASSSSMARWAVTIEQDVARSYTGHSLFGSHSGVARAVWVAAAPPPSPPSPSAPGAEATADGAPSPTGLASPPHVPMSAFLGGDSAVGEASLAVAAADAAPAPSLAAEPLTPAPVMTEEVVEQRRGMLRTVLRATAAAEPGLRYTQGMNFVARFLLELVLAAGGVGATEAVPGGDAAAAVFTTRAFNLLAAVLRLGGVSEHLPGVADPPPPLGVGLVSLLAHDNATLRLRLYQFDRLLARHLPALSTHIHAEGVSADGFASSWFLTLGTNFSALDVAAVARLWDAFLVAGWPAVHGALLTQLAISQPALRAAPFESLMRLLPNVRAVTVATPSLHAPAGSQRIVITAEDEASLTADFRASHHAAVSSTSPTTGGGTARDALPHGRASGGTAATRPPGRRSVAPAGGGLVRALSGWRLGMAARSGGSSAAAAGSPGAGKHASAS